MILMNEFVLNAEKEMETVFKTVNVDAENENTLNVNL